ncbi:LCP family protein [Cellulosimicrobium marinum]|uniref:LCP family protein n=1 Tax=Cellulosimicrobium marinum TaxID=1638992 RepID=UPI001E33E786|nr:LCP family protein [Cellulosimicrobium marinum]MCB7137166.1 LCP family protein [Cellulosimicrobium marinum]
MTSRTRARTAATPPSRGPAHARSLRTRSVARAVGLVATGALAFGVVGGASALNAIQGNLGRADVESLLTDRPEQSTPDPDDPNAGKPLNVLVLGSDLRGGDNGHEVEGVEGMRSDTTVLVHVSADRSRVEMISIPRDSRVDIPACNVTGGGTTAPVNTRFNAAFANGATAGGDIASAAACTMATVESLTDVYVDGFVVVDFAGFQEMIEALGGVEMCIPEAIDSPKADLVLPAGWQTLDGADALGFARARYGMGDGSDLKRIGRQQELMAAMARTVLEKNVLTDLGQLYGFVDAGTKSLTMSENLASIPSLAGLAFSLRGATSGNITFMTVPNAADPLDPDNKVVWTSEADSLWERIRADEPAEASSAAAAPAPADDAPAEATEPPSATEDEPSDAATTEETPAPVRTKDAGTEEFSAADETAQCG